MLSLWGWIWDVSHVVDGACMPNSGNCQRGGRVKVFLFTAAILASLRVSRVWHWSVGVFYFYMIAMWIQKGAPNYGFEDVVMVTAALFLIPEIAKHVSNVMFINIIIATSLLHCVVAVLNLFSIFPFLAVTVPLYAVGRIPIGLLGQETLLAPYLAFAFAVCIHQAIESKRLERYIALGIALFNLVIIIKCESVMGFVSLGAGILVLQLFYRGAYETCASVVVLAAGAFVSFKHGGLGFSGRLTPWLDAWEMIKLEPWTGYGAGSWSQVAQEIAMQRQSGTWRQLHSDWLQLVFEYGFIGLFLVTVLGLRVIGRVSVLCCLKDREMIPFIAGLAVFSANALGNFPLRIVPHSLLFAYCLYQCSRSQHAE